MKGVFVILDGVADEPCNALNGKTPLEAAKTPNLDKLAKKGKLDYCYTVSKGVAPESSSAVISLLGYDPTSAPRGVLEVIGSGMSFSKGDLALRCNFATIDTLEDGNILDARAGRTLTTREAEILAKSVNDKLKLPFNFEFRATSQHRAALVFRGGFSDNISDANPFYGNGTAKSNLNPKMAYSKSLDYEDDSKLSADLVNSFIRHSHEILKNHPINKERERKGLFPANIILCRGAGSEAVKLKKLKGKWIALGYMPLEIGIAKVAGMDVYNFRYPKMKGLDVYSTLYKGLAKATKYGWKMIKKYRKDYDYFYVHLKETDIPGHDNKPLDKVAMIEMIDSNFFSYLVRGIDKEKVIVVADHTTACRKKAHTDAPVPVLTYPYPGKGNPEKKGERYTEKEGLEGRKIIGKKLLEENFFK